MEAKDDGVNIPLGDQFSKFAWEQTKATANNSRHVVVHDFAEHNFRGPRGLRFVNLPEDCYFDVAADGIGTKVVFINEAMSQETAARDVMAMCAADITRWGGKVLVFCNVLDVSTLGVNAQSDTYKALAKAIQGLRKVADEQGIVLYRGETAELGPCVGSENPEAAAKFNWAGFAIGVYHPDRLIIGDDMATGDVVVAFWEDGFRSNGLSSVRAAMRRQYGDKWWDNPDAKQDIKEIATPSTLYDKFLSSINGWEPGGPSVPIKALAHISGGGIPSKFFHDILAPKGFSARLDNLFNPPDIMRRCGLWSGKTDKALYETWNGGQAVLAVIPSYYAERLREIASSKGIRICVAGEIFAERHPKLTIKSQFTPETLLVWEKDEK
ncbi:MAG: Phosphoribosylformylglycinamidine cyclo-ligase [Candidatus Adlerbacteria bacterium]|nr:Phosphoribosylformylglycinamidine cyclo-ligase [Candidatus Adlerbacteria bacterium]